MYATARLWDILPRHVLCMCVYVSVHMLLTRCTLLLYTTATAALRLVHTLQYKHKHYIQILLLTSLGWVNELQGTTTQVRGVSAMLRNGCIFCETTQPNGLKVNRRFGETRHIHFHLFATCFKLVTYFASSSTLNMEVTSPFET
jgi:hypothetical protein